MLEKLPQILLIDDDEDDRELLTTSLELLYLSVKNCDSGEKALEYLEKANTQQQLPTMIIPGHAAHCFNATEQFKMISTVIKSGYED